MLEYPLQQHRLLPLLAGSICFKLFGDYLSAHFAVCEARSLKNDSSSEFLALNAELHAISCGGKAVSTWFAFKAVQESRLACGGHGFSGLSTLASIREFADPFMTFEGDNFVLLQQLERYLLQKLTKQQYGSPMGSLRVLERFQAGARCVDWSLAGIAAALDQRAGYWLREGETVLRSLVAKESSALDMQDHLFACWNAAQPGALQQAAVSFMEALVMQESVAAAAAAPQSVRPVRNSKFRGKK